MFRGMKEQVSGVGCQLSGVDRWLLRTVVYGAVLVFGLCQFSACLAGELRAEAMQYKAEAAEMLYLSTVMQHMK